MNTTVHHPGISGVQQPSSLARLFRALHLLEKGYAIVAFALVAVEIARSDSDVRQFLALWAALAVLSVAAALWPRTPLPLTLFAEVFLTILVVGRFVSQNPKWLPILNRCPIVSDTMPVTERRFVAWNMIGGLFLAWTVIPYVAIIMNRPNGLSWQGILGWIGIVVVSLLMLVLVSIFAFGVVLGWS